MASINVGDPVEISEPGPAPEPGPPGLEVLSKQQILEPRRFGYEQIYRLLRRALLTRRIPAGTRLLESELAARLGVSRTPVREALRKLEGDGFATRARGGGLEVSIISLDEISDLFLVRGELDRLAARLACDRAKSHDWEAIRSQVARMQEAGVRSGVGSEAFNDLHLSLHASIYTIAFGARFAGLLNSHVLQYLEAAAELSYASPIETLPAGDQHSQLIDALASGDTLKAMTAADEHVSRSAFDARRSAAPVEEP